MTLRTLKNVGNTEAERILASLTSELLPNPETAPDTEGQKIDPKVYSELWKEIHTRLGIDPSDSSSTSHAKIFDLLFSEMSQTALSPAVLKSVKSKLSQKGELRSDLYEVKFSPSFEASESHGVRRNHALEAIRNADDTEHLNMLDGEVLFSFFLRLHSGTSKHDPFALLVTSIRVGYELDVGVGLRIYKSDIDYSVARRPSDFLRLLVEKYGFPVTVGHITAKLIINETTTIDPPINPDTLVKIQAIDGTNIYSDFMLRKRTLHNSYGIVIAFALDQKRYASDLRKHGVQVEDRDYSRPYMFTRPG